MNYAGKFGSGELDPFSGADIGLGPLLSPHGHLSSPGKFHVDKVSTHAPSDAVIVSDAHLLFHGDFKRSGVDLVLTSGDREVVLSDYFKGEKRAALASPDGAHLTGDIVNALTGHTQFAQAGGSASVAPALIGHVTKLAGNATAIRNGVSIILNQGDTVHKGDVVQSGSDSTLGITFIDGTVFGLASNAKMVLNEMVYDPNGSDNKSLLSLVQGTISFVAGATAKKGDMKVDTPVATMGIRGTAVLVEIDFEVPSQGGAPPAKFQVLVEPDGTTGSYILFDKTTLTPIATVNRAGTQTIINSQGAVSFQSSVQLSPDTQKLINDVFSQKFSQNNPNTKLTSNFTDSIVPETSFLKLASNDFVPVTLQFFNIPDRPAAGPSTGPTPYLDHIPGPPAAAAFGGSFAERVDITASAAVDSVSGIVSYADINPSDVPSVSTAFSSFIYANAQKVDVTATLTVEQLAAIKAVEVPLVVVQDPNGKNTGQATWTYNIADGAFDFLAAGETVALTYMARVDNNYAPSNETTFVPFTIVITGTNDKPTISATGGEITERIGTGNSEVDTVTGTVTFTDPDLTDRPVVTAGISTTDPFRYYDAEDNDVTDSLTPQQLAAIQAVQVPLTVVQAAGNSHNGSATWTYSIADGEFDFIAEGETLNLNYVAQVDDGHGGVISTQITVSIRGGDVVVVGTNDVPTVDVTSAAFAELSNDTQPNPTGSNTSDTASGTITFTDVDLTDRPVASTAFTSFTFETAVNTVTNALTEAQLAAIAAVQVPLTVTQAAGNTNNGSASWSYSVPDSAFDFLAEGEVLNLTYTATVDDGHGGVVTKPFTITVTGSNDEVEITSGAQTAAITEIVGAHGSDEANAASGSIKFADVDLTDTHEFTVTGVTAAGVMTGLADHDTQFGWLTLGDLTDSTDGILGSQVWSFSAPDSYFDYLADGETVTLTYTVEVDDHHGGLVTKPVTVTITGTNDVPTLAAEDAGKLTDTAADDSFGSLTGTLAGTDVDHGETDSLTYAALDGSSAVNTAVAGLYGSLTVNSDGTYTYVPNAAAINALHDGSYTDTFTVQTIDVHGAIGTAILTVEVTGANDTPSIVGEVNPPAQIVVVAAPASPHVLAAGVNVNSLGLSTETFDGLTADSSSNGGAGRGNFDSAALGAHFSASGNAGITVGSSSLGAAPFVGPAPGHQDTTKYLSILGNATETITFTSQKNAFGLYWGSVDSYNSIKFYDGTTLVASYTGADVSPLLSNGNQGSFAANGYVEFTGLHSFNKVELSSSSNAFEIDNISAGYIPPPTLKPVAGTLSVHDADIGDTLTAFVTGNATVEYNGSTTLPGGIDISALLNAGNVTFDSMLSNGGTVVLQWTYHPINADLDFLHAGDVLKINFVAEVSDGHGHTGSQPLTVTLVGADSAANASTASATGPVIGTDAFTVTELDNGVTKISGLYVSDADTTASTDTFTASVATGNVGSSVTPSTGSGSGIAGINAALNNGIVYDPHSPQPQTDSVTLTVADSFGHTDRVHFIFNQGGPGPDVALTGTSGKDVIFATGHTDTLTGGVNADQFVFTPEINTSADTITDFKPDEDHIDLRAFSFVDSSNIAGWLGTHAATSGADTLLSLNSGDSITLKNVALASLHASDFIVSPHH
ncbi:VCBS domain-containing protein [Bradyrhizobium sp. 200]|uniref:VCBS domain-containing protein n=1 Tax=Bradyrhizobium sp. 200 TaxID=2782665 RepID=UPI001FFEABAB|nr:VCBS domain-containing protein [Bradyrhizobium sp. 200]